MTTKSQEKGQALIIIALAAVGLFAFAALAIDGGMVFSDRRHAQNAADTAVLAAALARIRGQDYSAAALDRASSNGYDIDADSNVEVHLCDEVGVTCQGLPASADTPEEKAEYIQVKITSTVRTTFARIIGRTSVTHTLEAIARATLGEPGPLFEGKALAAMSEHDPNALSGHGNVFLDVIGGGVFVNSDAGPSCPGGAMGVVGNGTYQAPVFELVGTLCQSGQPNIDESRVQPTDHVSPFADIDSPNITCAGPGGLNGTTFIPGTYGNINIPGGTYTFENGSYCFTGGVSVNGNTNLIVNDAQFLITSGEFVSNANGTFDCTNLLVHIDGGSGMRFNGGSEITCTGVTFFASTGTVTWNGNVANTLSAPSGGDYANLLIYMPSTNNSALSINGNSENALTGSIIAVASPITITGNSGTVAGTFQLSSQIVGYTVDVGGNGTIEINYDPARAAIGTDPATIQLTK